jgi:hypothetical protein
MGSYRTPNTADDNNRAGFLCGICCEALCYSVLPIFYGLYLFEGLGKKNEPAFDCYANWYYDYAVPGIMDVDDEYWVNVSELFRAILIAEFAITLFALLVLLPLRLCTGLQYFNNRDRSTPAGVQEQLTSIPAVISYITGFFFVAVSIATVVVRLIHVGRVCSGDFLADLEKENDVIRQYYDIEVGIFLFAITILSIITIVFTLLFWCCCCGALCCLGLGLTS